MAEIKNLKESEKNPKNKQYAKLEDYPKLEESVANPLVQDKDKKEKKRTRAGYLPGGLNPYGKPHLIEDGRKVKS